MGRGFNGFTWIFYKFIRLICVNPSNPRPIPFYSVRNTVGKYSPTGFTISEVVISRVCPGGFSTHTSTSSQRGCASCTSASKCIVTPAFVGSGPCHVKSGAALSFAAGHAVSTETADTFIDGVACRVPDPTAIDVIVRGATRGVEVSEDLCADAVRLLLHTTHNLPEPAGAIATAGLMTERERQQGKRVGVVMSGGNMADTLLPTLISGGTPTT